MTPHDADNTPGFRWEPLRFGRYFGRPLWAVPSEYLMWLASDFPLWPATAALVEAELEYRAEYDLDDDASEGRRPAVSPAAPRPVAQEVDW